MSTAMKHYIPQKRVAKLRQPHPQEQSPLSDMGTVKGKKRTERPFEIAEGEASPEPKK